MSNIAASDVGKSLKCWLKFTGTENQRVLIRVRSLRVGTYKEREGCAYGQMKISDGSGDWNRDNYHPTVLCGYYERDGTKRINLRRFSSQNSAKVDFWVTQAASTTGYDIEAQFVDVNDERDGIRGAYGNYHNMRGRIPNTKCDWVVPVDECDSRSCSLVSPGYPGIYPPNTECLYHLKNNKNERVELTLNSKRGGKFDMKRSEDCRDDYVKVYDGSTVDSPLIGTFCAHEGGDFISSAESLLIQFKSGQGGPPWDYSGFEGHVSARWSNEPSGGLVTRGGTCDFTISEDNSTSMEGSMNTPDHRIPPGTACTYKFISFPNHHVVIDYTIKYMSEKCDDYLEFFENDVMVAPRKCSDQIEQGRRNEFRYTSYGPNVTVRYYHRKGQMVNKDPIFIDYEFKQTTSGTPQIKASAILLLTLFYSLYITS